MLNEEKSKTAKLRTDLVANLTSMILGFTDAQDASWSETVAKVQSENSTSLEEMEDFARASEGIHAESSARASRLQQDLSVAQDTSERQREAGREVSPLQFRVCGY